MALRFSLGKPIFDQDVELYYKYGSLILAGKPVSAEYPEMALLIFALAAFPSRSLMDFRVLYPLMTLPLGCLATYIIYRLGLLLGDGEVASAFAVLYALSPFTAIFWMFKLDEVAVAFALVGLYCIALKRQFLLGFVTALGFLVKWFPALILPAALIYYFKSSFKSAVKTIGAFVATVTAVMFMFHHAVASRWLHAYAFHSYRPINGESLYYLVEYALTGELMKPSGWVSPVYMTNSLVFAVASAATVTWLVYLAIMVNRGDINIIVYFSALTVIFAIIFNKIYSTQFITWLLPAVLICLAQLYPEIRLAHGSLAATIVQVLNYLKTPILSDTPWWIIPSLLFWAINIALFTVFAWKGYETVINIKSGTFVYR